MITTVTLNPSVDRTLFLDGLKIHGTNRVKYSETDAGGKGLNVSRIVRESGGETLAIAFLGGGPGAFIEAVLAREEVPLCNICIDGETRMNVSVEDGSGEPPTTLNERGPEVSNPEWQDLLSALRKCAPKSQWIAIGGSVPRGVPEDADEQIFREAREAGAMVAVDVDGPRLARAVALKPDLIKPNRDEASALLNREIASLEDALEAAKELHSKGIRYAMVSMGSLGACLACGEGAFTVRAPEIESKSTIGSGDSLIGGFLHWISDGKLAVDALRWGVACGAATALSSGAAIGIRPDMERLFDQAKVSGL